MWLLFWGFNDRIFRVCDTQIKGYGVLFYNRPFFVNNRSEIYGFDVFKDMEEDCMRKEGNVLLNDILSTFYLQLYCI